MRSPIVLVAGLISIAAPLLAQDTTCAYARCALRLQYKSFSAHVVAGLDATPVTKLTLFGGRVDVLAQSRDSIVRQLYEGYRSDRKKALGLNVVMFAVTTAGWIVYYADRRNDTNFGVGFGLIATGFVLSFPTGMHRARSMDRLSRSIWHYNEGLRP